MTIEVGKQRGIPRDMLRCVCFVLLCAACGGEAPRPAVTDGAFEPALFADPPIDYAPEVRWWWPGGAVASVQGA